MASSWDAAWGPDPADSAGRTDCCEHCGERLGDDDSATSLVNGYLVHTETCAVEYAAEGEAAGLMDPEPRAEDACKCTHQRRGHFDRATHTLSFCRHCGCDAFLLSAAEPVAS